MARRNDYCVEILHFMKMSAIGLRPRPENRPYRSVKMLSYLTRLGVFVYS